MKKKETFEDYCMELFGDVKPRELGNTNKTGKCGIKVKKLYPCKVGQVDFMICECCKEIMDR